MVVGTGRLAVQVLKGKPSPDIYLVAAKRLGVEPKHCLVSADTVEQRAFGEGMRLRFVKHVHPRPHAVGV